MHQHPSTTPPAAAGTVVALPSREHRDSIGAVKAVVRERCRHLKLGAADTAACVDHAAKLKRRGRSGAVAVHEGIAMAKQFAEARDRAAGYTPPGAA